jgi:hypothetical protein
MCLITQLENLFEKQKPIGRYDFHIFSNLDDIPQKCRISQTDNLLFSSAYLKTLENNIENLDNRYIVVTEKDENVLFAHFNIYCLSYKNFKSVSKNHFLHKIFKFLLQIKKIKILVLGNMLISSENNYICLQNKLSLADIALILNELSNILAEKEQVAITIFHQNQAMLNEINSLNASELLHTSIQDKTMELEISSEWKDLNTYFNDLSRKYKTRAKKIWQSKTELTIKKLSQSELINNERQIFELFENVVQKQNFSLNLVSANYFSELQKALNDNFELIGFWHGNDLVAFYSAILSESDYEIHYIGMEYNLNPIFNLYFNILFSGLERAIEFKKSKLKLGRTSFDAKASLGATMITHPFIAKINQIPIWVVDSFECYFQTIKEDKNWQQRQPFKQKQVEVSEETHLAQV